MYNRYDPGLLDVIFELAGGGGGKAGRIRVWSAMIMVLMTVLAAIGGYMFLIGSPTTLTAAEIEDGRRPNLFRWARNGRRAQNHYRITGGLADGDAVVFGQGQTTWRCAPLLSDRAGSHDHPGVYYAASEARFRRARAEDRFVGELYSPTGNFLGRVRPEATACDVPSDALLLIDDGSLRGFRESGRSMLIIAAVVGGIALAAFLTALRKQDDVAPQPPTLPD